MLKQALFLLFFSVSIALKAQFDLAYTLGYGLNNVKTSDPYPQDAYSFSSSPKFGINTGLLFEYRGEDLPVFFQSGLFLNNKKYDFLTTVDSAGSSTVINSELNNFYLRIPLYIGYNYQLSEKHSLFVKSGIVLGIGLGGTYSSVISTNNSEIDEESGAIQFVNALSIENYGYFINSNDYFRTRIDFAGHFALGYRWDIFSIEAGYDLSLNRIEPKPTYPITDSYLLERFNRNLYFNLSIYLKKPQ